MTPLRRSRAQPRGTRNEDLCASAGQPAGRRVVLLARSGLLGRAVASSSLAPGPVNVLERSYNKFRTGADTAETVLTPANVKSSANLFHKQFVVKVDGKIGRHRRRHPQRPLCRHHAQYRHCLRCRYRRPGFRQMAGAPITGFHLGVLKPVTIHSEFGVVSTPVIEPDTGTILCGSLGL